MICTSCGQNLNSQFFGEALGATSMYYCHPCREEYITWNDVKPGCWTLEKGKYRLHFNPDTKVCQIQQVYMDIESDTSVMYRWYSILEINTLPEGITEENFDEKVKLMLVFS